MYARYRILMNRKSPFLLAAILWSLNTYAQYHGGTNDGFNFTGVINNNLSPVIYKGGNNDGFSFVKITSENASPVIYHGGNNDGFSFATVTNQNAGPDIYSGGSNDGFSSVRIINQNAGPNIYSGGNNDGFASVRIINQNAGPNIYSGGINDGFSSVRIINQNAGPDIYAGGNNDGWSSYLASIQNPAIVNSITLNLRMLIEGYYIGGGLMQAAPDPFNHPLLADTVLIELRNNVSPYALAFSQKGTINTNGNGSFIFPTGPSSYYMVVKHRNALETWSASPVQMNSLSTYDFTNSQSKAYGNNMVNVGALFNEQPIWAFYSGDISDPSLGLGYQDGIIESQDYLEMENAVSLISTGYIIQDITGDDIVESQDYLIMENNVGAIIFVVRP
jgi:hypothetical protein